MKYNENVGETSFFFDMNIRILSNVIYFYIRQMIIIAKV